MGNYNTRESLRKSSPAINLVFSSIRDLVGLNKMSNTLKKVSKKHKIIKKF